MPDNPAQDEAMRLAAIVAHQLKSPVATVVTILKTLSGEYVGPLNAQQKDLLARATARCEQAIESARRLLAIARALEGAAPGAARCDLAALVRRRHGRWVEEAAPRGIELVIDVPDSLVVAADEPLLEEILEALVGNALKYTPDRGRIRIRAAAEDGQACLRVADSGMGIPHAHRQKVFEPFFRTPSAQSSSRPGTGLGLTLVQALARSLGGAAQADLADLGGAELIVRLPLARAAPSEKTPMSKPFRVVIVGGVAAGPKAASKIIRLRSDAEVAIVDSGRVLSYAGCGLPYYISGVIKDHRQLLSTAAGVVRDPVFFQKVKNVHVMDQTEAVEIDRAGRRIRVRDLDGGAESWLEYDKLVLATGASPIVPHIPGVTLRNIFTLHGVSDAEGIKAALAEGKARDVVIVGGGLIGVEVTEALVAKGCRVTIVEMRDQILRILDWEVAALVEQHMEAHGVKVLTGTRACAFRGEGRVQSVETDKGPLPADLVILGIGVRPNVRLAQSAGLAIGPTGAIAVDDRLRTSDPDIYAAGDCVECRDLLTGQPTYVPLGSTANKQGRCVAVNVCGGDDVFPGVLGTTLCKVFDYCVARTGLTEAAARRLGKNVVTVLCPGPDRAHYMPAARMLMLKLVVEAGTGKLLGVQAIGPGAADKRIDVAAMALTAGMTVHQLANADLGYAPPYSDAMDNLITAANVARNKLDGHLVGISPVELHGLMQAKAPLLLLDVRTPAEHEQQRLPESTLVPLGSLRGRLEDLPRDRPIVTYCGIALRAYEAALILRSAGFADVRVLDGGLAMWPFEKVQ